MAHPQLPEFDLTRGVFTARMAEQEGLSPSMLATVRSAGAIIRLHRGAYVRADRYDGTGPAADRVRFTADSVAATLVTRTAVASHASMIALVDLPLWTPPSRPCVTVAPKYTGDARHAHLHRARLLSAVERGGFAHTTCARAVLDIAREHSVEDAVVAGDAAIARGMLTEASLTRNAEFCAGWPGTRRANAAIALLDGRSESPIESISRLRLSSLDLPVPEPQVWIYAHDGRRIGRLDFYWDELGVAGEVDGRAKYGDDPRSNWWLEKKRQEAMEDLGLIFVRWGRYELDRPDLLHAKVLSVFARAARRPTDARLWTAVSSGSRFAPLTRTHSGNLPA